MLLYFNKIRSLFGADGVSTLIVTLALFTSGFFAYLLQFLLGRFLTVEGFGDFNALLSLLTVLSFLTSVFGLALVKVISELYVAERYGVLRSLFKKVIFGSVVIGVCVSLGLLLLGGTLESTFNLSYPHLVLYYSLSFTLSLATHYFASFFQGAAKFVFFSAHIIIGNFFRFVIPILLILFLRADPGLVYLGFALAQLLSFLLGIIFYKLVGLRHAEGDQVHAKGSVRAQFKRLIVESIPLTMITGVMILLSNNDLLLVKSFLDPYQAGLYAGAVTLGKVILFGSGAVTTVMFPRIVAVKNTTIVIKKIKQFTAIQLLFIVFPLIFYIAMPRQITLLLFGEKFIQSVPYLPIYAIYISFWVFINYLLTLAMALDMRKIAYIVPIFALTQYAGITLYHQNLYIVLAVNMTTVSLFLVSVLLYFFLSKQVKRM